LRYIALFIIALLAIFFWLNFDDFAGHHPTNKSNIASENPEDDSDSPIHESNPLRTDLNDLNSQEKVPEEILARIRSEFSDVFPSLFSEYMGDFLALEEERLQAHIDSEKNLPLDKFFLESGYLLDKIPLNSPEDFESLTIFQMEHCQNLLNSQNRAYIRFSTLPADLWQSFSLEKLEANSFRFPPDVLYSYLSGKTPESPSLIMKLGDIRSNTLLALADVFQRRMLLNRTARNYLEVECGLNYHTPGFDDAVKLALEQTGMAQSLQDEEDMIMHRYLNQIRYEAQLANPDIVVR